MDLLLHVVSRRGNSVQVLLVTYVTVEDLCSSKPLLSVMEYENWHSSMVNPSHSMYIVLDAQ